MTPWSWLFLVTALQALPLRHALGKPLALARQGQPLGLAPAQEQAPAQALEQVLRQQEQALRQQEQQLVQVVPREQALVLAQP